MRKHSMEKLDDIVWFGHASFKLTDSSNASKVYYIDPYQLPNTRLDKADVIFVTHPHPDHLSPDDIKKILKPTTIVIGAPTVIGDLDIADYQKLIVEPNQSYEVSGLHFETVPQYNVNPEKLQFHPKSNNWVGYIFEINGKKIYHSGDTDFIPEMRDLASKNLDIALLSMGGTYTMEVEEMIEAANAIAAKYTIPMHYKRLLGESAKEAEEKLKSGVKNSKVLILNEIR